MAWFLNRYHCDACDTSWQDEWSCCCDDECPECGDDLSPEDSDDLTVIVEGCEVGVSPASAEDDADYDWRTFASPEKAERFAARVRRLMAADKLPSFNAFAFLTQPTA
ncbi:MAG: hypothetical protein FD152_3184 [Xanthobacteraceae bacterium]|nr:MAG: hypothetical protein FD152_3184 [Xanthobacteraceae bacterium]